MAALSFDRLIALAAVLVALSSFARLVSEREMQPACLRRMRRRSACDGAADRSYPLPHTSLLCQQQPTSRVPAVEAVR